MYALEPVAAGTLDAAISAAEADGSRRAAEAGYHAQAFLGIAACGTKPG